MACRPGSSRLGAAVCWAAIRRPSRGPARSSLYRASMRRMTNPCARLGCLHRPEDKAAVFVKFSSALQDASKQARRQKTRRIHPRCTRRHAYTDPLVDHGPAAAIAARTSAVLTPKQHSRCTPNRRETAPQRRRRDSSKKKCSRSSTRVQSAAGRKSRVR